MGDTWLCAVLLSYSAPTSPSSFPRGELCKSGARSSQRCSRKAGPPDCPCQGEADFRSLDAVRGEERRPREREYFVPPDTSAGSTTYNSGNGMSCLPLSLSSSLPVPLSPSPTAPPRRRAGRGIWLRSLIGRGDTRKHDPFRQPSRARLRGNQQARAAGEGRKG